MDIAWLRFTLSADMPPAFVFDAGPAIVALWWAARGGLSVWPGPIPCTEPNWEAAHRICQASPPPLPLLPPPRLLKC